MQYRSFLLALVLLSLLLAASAYSAVELYDAHSTLFIPAFIDYTLNCPADVTIEILPCTVGGTPTGPAVRTVTFTGQSRGFHRYIWLGDMDGGGTAPYGYYVARITANATQAQWNPISGLYKNDDWTHEYAPRPALPTVPDTEGFYGIGINKNPNSDFYGRMYVTHKTQKDILMYGPAGNYLGTFHDSSISWGGSAPWDLAVADDGWVYVSDRSNMIVHCFSPDGNLASTSPTVVPSRAIFARTTPDGRTHVFVSGGGNGIRELIVEPDHVTWTQPIIIYDTGGGDGWDAYGMWVSPDLQTLYQACNQGPNVGLTRWLRQPGGTYVKDAGWVSNVGACIDVDANGLGNPTEFLWVTKMVAYGTGVRAIHKVSVATGNKYYPPNADYDIVTWALMCCTDRVGNVGVTFGKSTATWAQRYWGLFAEPGASTAQKLLDDVIGSSDQFCPYIIPGTVVWTPDNVIAGNDIDSASVSFKILDMHGWQDVERVTIGLTCLGYPPRDAVITMDPSDPMGRTAIATISNIKAKVGARCSTSFGQPPHYLPVTVYGQYECGQTDPTTVYVSVTGHIVDGVIKHRRVAGWNVPGAVMQAVGGGIPGATEPCAAGPFVYSAPCGYDGSASVEVSAGNFGMTAQKTGFGSESPVSVTAPYGGGPIDLYLRPLSVQEARSIGGAVNVEGVCFAWPVGYPPTAANGLDARMDTLSLRNQWYICDPNDPAHGVLCLITKPDWMFPVQWDDPLGEDDFGNPTYLGERPALGDTIMYTGTLDTPAGYETRVLAADADIMAALVGGTTNRIYLNEGDLGGLPGIPRSVTCAQLAANTFWGQFVKVDAWVVGHPSANIYTIADGTGTAEMLLETPTTLGITQLPGIGCHYSLTGAAGRTEQYGNGCIRIRRQTDMVVTSGSCGADELGAIRDAAPGASVQVHGIVTGKWTSYFYIDNADREVGVRVRVTAPYIAAGDDVKVSGTVAIEDGEKVIVADPPSVLSSGNQIPAPFDLRTREVGGVSFDANNPGVSTGRGALNVGLRIHIQGMVTGIGAGNAYYYLWDGANRTDMPVSDGNADGFIGVRIEAAPPTGIYAWQDWVDVTGIVSTDASIVPGVVAPTIIPTSASKVTTFDTITTPPGSPFRAPWSLIALPAVPAGTSDGDEWTPKPWEGYMVLTPNKIPDELDGRIYRWDNCGSNLELWDMWPEVGSHGPFGGLLLGDGYWLMIDENWPVSYSGKSSSLDQWIGICHEGWMILGHPKDHNTFLADAKVHAGDRVVSMYDAIFTENWIDCMGYWWDETNQGLVDIGIPDCWASNDTLRPWHGYWLQVYRGDLALIVPESPVAP